MSEIIDIINDVFANSEATGITTTPTAETIAQNGITNSISKVYVAGEGPASALYNGPEYGVEVGEEIPIIYGELLISGEVIEGAIERSELDPERVIRRHVVRIGDGQNAGISTSGGDASKNIFLGCGPLKNDTNEMSFADVAVRELLGSTAKVTMGQIIPEIIFGDTDTTTGKDILGLKDPKKNAAVTQASEGLAAGYPGAIMYYDEGVCGWTAKHFVTAFQESGITGEKITVWEDITQKSADAIKFIFKNATVTDNGDRSVTVEANVEATNVGTGSQVYKDNAGGTVNLRTIKAGTNVTVTTSGDEIVISASSGGTDPGGGSGSGSFGVCDQQIFVCFDPAASTTYTLRRNGSTIKSFTTGSNPTRLDLAVGLSSNITATQLYSVSPVSTTDQGLPMIKISKGYDPCLPCDVGTWAIYDNTGAVKCYNAPASCGTLPPSFD